MKILNLTQHQATPEQKDAGVVDLVPEIAEAVRDLLTFDKTPVQWDMCARAYKITKLALATDVRAVMIGPVGYFARHLEDALLDAGFTVLHAFSKRDCVEQQLPDGSVEKQFMFRHLGFYEVPSHKAHGPRITCPHCGESDRITPLQIQGPINAVTNTDYPCGHCKKRYTIGQRVSYEVTK